MSDVGELKKFIDRSFKDPIAGVLLKHSNLTRIQYETLLIDLISGIITDNGFKYVDKVKLRSKKVSRGSFRRTLAQARRNVISAMYTILLLSYIGIFDEAPFNEYQILSEKLRDYVKIIYESEPAWARNYLEKIERNLMEGLKELANPRRLKIM